MCYQDTKDCPITDILFISSSAKSTYEGKGYTVIDFNSTLTTGDDAAMIAYSKTVDKLPATSFQIGADPCIQPSTQSLAKGEEVYPTTFYAGNC